MQFLSNGTDIAVGSLPEEKLIVAMHPRTWQVPVSINDDAVRDAKADRDEIAKRQESEEDENDEGTNS
jgi:hypothetical protein